MPRDARIGERQLDDTGPPGSEPCPLGRGCVVVHMRNGEQALAVSHAHCLSTYSAPPLTLGRVGNAGKSSSSAIANTLGSVSAMVGSASKPSGWATSTSTSWYRYMPVPAGMR